MGINIHYYTVYGVKIDKYDNEFSEAEEEVYDELKASEDLDVIMDGMGGSYMIFGKIFFDSGNLRWGDEGDVWVEIEPDWLKSYKVKAKNEFIRLFPKFAHYMDEEWKLMTFVHYS